MENKVLQAHIEVGQVKIWRERGEQDRVWTCQVGEGRQKAEEDIRSLEDRGNHLAKVKGKLEQSLDEAEDALEREKKSKGDVQKLQCKVEGDLKLTQEAVCNLERVKEDMVATQQRKDKEAACVAAKIEDEKTLGFKYTKQVKELQCRVEEVDESQDLIRQIKEAENAVCSLGKSKASLATQIEDT